MKQSRKNSRTGRTTVVLYSSALLSVGGIVSAAVFLIPAISTIEYSATAIESNIFSSSTQKIEVVKHLKTPEPLKAIYMSQCVVGTPSFRDDLVKLVDETELNALVIDIKDFTGKISFTTDNPKLSDSVSDECGALDMKEFIKRLHEKDVYVIGRITVFQSPYHTKLHPEWAVQKKSVPGEVWKDYKGLSFIDVSATPYWEYIVELSKEAYAIGFDELNYDYVRYPSDGPMADVNATWAKGKAKADALEDFFAYLSKQVKPTGAVLSADLFGMTTTNTDDLNIGQVLERSLPYFDYIAPMVYPSHFPKSFLNLGNPNKEPYKVVHHSMSEAAKRTMATTTTVSGLTHAVFSTTTKPHLYSKEAYSPLKLRPWLQDFDYGGEYGPDEVRAQIQATYDAGLTSWMLWAPSNRYTRAALDNVE